MPRLTIDGKEIEVPAGANLIEAARRLGIEIPHYCYHPGLSIAGQCRLCMVELEKNPRPQIACNMVAMDGMVVHTQTPKVLETRKSIMEFHLINHPLDCPVCDQAGECWLQIYYMKHGLYDSRFVEEKVHKPKAVPLGPHVILDAERCILCSRCTRFCDEITKTGELGIFNRGDHSEVGLFPGKVLDNRYSGNVVDICPVGALTDRDFRFQVRVWYLDTQKSVCPGCSRGCNIEIHSNVRRPHHAQGRRVARLKPRYNPHVNDWWICDAGRYGFGSIDQGRITFPQLREGGSLREVTWQEALALLIDRLRAYGPDEIGLLASPEMTNEELFLIRRLAETLGVKNLDFQVPPREPGDEDDFLLRADKNPNTRGAEAIGLWPADRGLDAWEMLEALRREQLKCLWVFHHDVTRCGWPEGAVLEALQAAQCLIYTGSNVNGMTERAHLVLPAATYAEKDGTFTNFGGRVQRIRKALPPLGDSRAGWEILGECLEALNAGPKPNRPEEVFRALAHAVPAFAGLTYRDLGEYGLMLREVAHGASR
jgi:NADH-quinone oxidoreductase subunit G